MITNDLEKMVSLYFYQMLEQAKTKRCIALTASLYSCCYTKCVNIVNEINSNRLSFQIFMAVYMDYQRHYLEGDTSSIAEFVNIFDKLYGDYKRIIEMSLLDAPRKAMVGLTNFPINKVKKIKATLKNAGIESNSCISTADKAHLIFDYLESNRERFEECFYVSGDSKEQLSDALIAIATELEDQGLKTAYSQLSQALEYHLTIGKKRDVFGNEFYTTIIANHYAQCLRESNQELNTHRLLSA